MNLPINSFVHASLSLNKLACDSSLQIHLIKKYKIIIKIMNKNITNKQFQDSFDDDEFLDLDYVAPDNENLDSDSDLMKDYDPDLMKNLGLDNLNSNFEFVQRSLDSDNNITVPKDNIDKNILDFESYRITTVCFYVIYNIVHKKYYVGQTTNLNRRIFDHIRNLDRQTHSNEDLQDDFNNIKNQGLELYKCFKVYTIQNTPIMRSYSAEESYALKIALIRIEKLLIKAYREAGLEMYNKSGFTKGKSKSEINRENRKNQPPDVWTVTREIEERNLTNCSLSPSSQSVPVIINGVRYSSISEASKELNLNRRHVFYCILSKRFPNYKTEEHVKTGVLYVYYKKDSRQVKFTNSITGEVEIFPNVSQCNEYLTKLKRKFENDSETTTEYKKAGIFVDKNTIYRKLDKKEGNIFSYIGKDLTEKVLYLYNLIKFYYIFFVEK